MEEKKVKKRKYPSKKVIIIRILEYIKILKTTTLIKRVDPIYILKNIIENDTPKT